MVRARHNNFGCWFLFLMTSIFFFLASFLALSHFGLIQTDAVKKLDEKSFVVMEIFIAGPFLLFLYFISIYIKNITIEPEKRTITFQNIITRNERFYEFGDFDGFVDTFLTHKSGRYKTIGLVKDKRVARYIDSFYCSNYQELRDALQGLPYLGTVTKAWKVLLRQPVLE